MIDYRYRTFVDLVETKNYTKTAERLNFSQPAVTKHIQYIEQTLKVKLFTYEDRQLVTTTRGNYLYEKIKQLIRESEDIISSLQGNSNLRIGASKTIGEYLISDKIKKYNQNFPNSEVFLMVDNTSNLFEQLQKGKIDLALISGPLPNSFFPSTPFIEDEIILICSPEHPLANRTITISDIFSSRLFIRESGSGILESIEYYLNNLNLNLSRFKQVKTFGSISLIKSLVSQNEGISFVYKISVEKELEDKQLRQIHLSNFKPKQSFYFVQNPLNSLNDPTEFFLTLF